MTRLAQRPSNPGSLLTVLTGIMPVQSSESVRTRERKRPAGLLAGVLALLVLAPIGGGFALLEARTPIVVGRYALLGPQCVPRSKWFAARTRTRAGLLTNATVLVFPGGKSVMLAETHPTPRRFGPFTIYGP